ncbi:16S rRNA (cytosine967-C5)-methyltransferase [Rhodovulum bhavnagarense]|uniref:16S rRNA (Cytosine967-C5)-methyltransferase n=1 Tax=Rhodovulum bhavnagarense TaxID=992286 RepID=A0A4R2RU38_9RHOB|nr:RsmB/NOP family class I SAM-dependent RNA methyltransferase [Rhodovulum bhavnagarense]TCP63431.1 16S rRNA (cytosine967-C5)-methyltransferase [Rhodovulum bhavnagarense]
MTPAARVAAAIGLLDEWLAGAPAERLLTNWARANRYAGARDRAAIRDLVFDALRRCRSVAALGGAQTGRAMMIGLMRARGEDLNVLFTGEGYGPAPLCEAEWNAGLAPDDLPELVGCDCPEALAPVLRDSLGRDFLPVMHALQDRAPVFLRVNTRLASLEQARATLAAEGIETRSHPLSPTALEVTSNARRIQAGRAFADGLVELQDAASQAVADMMPLIPGGRFLDYCAGGGGKTLALAARGEGAFFAHDAAPERMRDLPDRANRAGVRVTIAARPQDAGLFDLVLCDVPCSGSGAWRRSPEAKWRMTPDDLARLTDVQAAILDRAAGLVGPGGALGYATCSLISAENGAQIDAFVQRNPAWRVEAERQFSPLEGGDGFFAAVLRRETGEC